MKEIIENGFTIYVSKNEDRLVGLALRNFDDKPGIQPLYMEEETLRLLDNFSFNGLLGEGKTLQIYKGIIEGKRNLAYIAQIGNIVKEGPYGENDCLEIIAEAAENNFYDVLINLEEQCGKLEKGTYHAPLKKAIRPYGSTKYECKR